MPWSRRLVAPLLVAGLLLPGGATLGQGDLRSGWTTSDDGMAFATNDTFAQLPAWRELVPAEFPDSISAIPGPERLYEVSGTLDTGARVARVIDAGGLAWLREGRTPLLATALVDDDGAAWARTQHVVSMPSGCPADRPDCLLPDLFAALADQAAPPGTPVGPIFGDQAWGPGTIASTAVVAGDGTLFSVGGGASVETIVRVRDDGKVAVRGQAEIGGGLGGRLRGYDALVIDAADGQDIDRIVQRLGSVATQARKVRDAGANQNGTNRRVFECPRSREGYVLSQYLVNGLGRAVGPAIDPGLDGGVAVLVTDVAFFDCGPGPGADPPVSGPAAAFFCASDRAQHQLFKSTQNGQQKTSNSSLLQRWAMITLGFAPGAAAYLALVIGDANDGAIFTVGLEGVQLESAAHPDAVLWLGESQVGIDSFGPKPYRELQLTVDGTTFDLVDQQRDAMGKAFDVGPSQKPETNCPGFDFTAEDAQGIFADGFESGDVSAWATPNAD